MTLNSKFCDTKPEICDINVANSIKKCSEIECDEQFKFNDFYFKESNKSEKSNDILGDTLPNGECNAFSPSNAINETKVNYKDNATKNKFAITINETKNTQNMYKANNITNFTENTETYKDIKTSDYCNDTLANTNHNFDDTLTTFNDTLNKDTSIYALDDSTIEQNSPYVKLNSDNINIENSNNTSTRKLANYAHSDDSFKDNLTKPEKFSISARKR